MSLSADDLELVRYFATAKVGDVLRPQDENDQARGSIQHLVDLGVIPPPSDDDLISDVHVRVSQQCREWLDANNT